MVPVTKDDANDIHSNGVRYLGDGEADDFKNMAANSERTKDKFNSGALEADIEDSESHGYRAQEEKEPIFSFK